MLYYLVKIFLCFFFKVATTEGKACLSCMVALYNFSKNGVVKKSSSLKPSSESASTHRSPLAVAYCGHEEETPCLTSRNGKCSLKKFTSPCKLLEMIGKTWRPL